MRWKALKNGVQGELFPRGGFIVTMNAAGRSTVAYDGACGLCHRTVRFLLVTQAARLTRIGGRHVLRLPHNFATEALYASIAKRLAA